MICTPLIVGTPLHPFLYSILEDFNKKRSLPGKLPTSGTQYLATPVGNRKSGG